MDSASYVPIFAIRLMSVYKKFKLSKINKQKNLMEANL